MAHVRPLLSSDCQETRYSEVFFSSPSRAPALHLYVTTSLRTIPQAEHSSTISKDCRTMLRRRKLAMSFELSCCVASQHFTEGAGKWHLLMLSYAIRKAAPHA